MKFIATILFFASFQTAYAAFCQADVTCVSKKEVLKSVVASCDVDARRLGICHGHATSSELGNWLKACHNNGGQKHENTLNAGMISFYCYKEEATTNVIKGVGDYVYEARTAYKRALEKHKNRAPYCRLKIKNYACQES